MSPTSSDGDGSVGLNEAAIRKYSSLAPLRADELDEIETVNILRADSEFTKSIMQRLETLASSYYRLGSPRTDLLLHIIQFKSTHSCYWATTAASLAVA